MDKVFGYKKGEKVTFLLDLLQNETDESIFRKILAEQWQTDLENEKIPAESINFNATKSHNADLPETCFIGKEETDFKDVFSKTDIIIALTEFSATAPLHKLSKKYHFRAASMPGFNEKMMPALELDFDLIKEKVELAYNSLKVDFITIVFEVQERECEVSFDLRHRKPLKDDGNCRKKGTVINLPTGEAFIAPNDKPNSKTQGTLPIQQGEKVNFYKVENNKIVSAEFEDELIKKIKKDTVVGNIAELAFGVLDEFGIKPCGKILLDEKLGLHIALGRNDHFGGRIGSETFKNKKNVWHQDYVYIEEIQPLIKIKEIKF